MQDRTNSPRSFRRACLMEGLDEIAITLESEPEIAAYEARAEMLD